MQKRMCLEESSSLDKLDLKNNPKDRNPLLDKILFQRGLTDEEEIDKFLNPVLENLYDPFLLKDMNKAVKRIKEALSRNEKIIVFGDYDVDGITASTLLYLFFERCLDTDISTYLPDRHQEGYGLNIDAVKGFIEDDFKLLISVDCGITAFDEVNYAVNNGLDVIITDHHQSDGRLPDAEAVIDPHRSDDTYPFKELAGVGVAFKLCHALEIELKGKDNISDELQSLLEVVTLGTVADIVPLKDENRIMVKKGLELINNSSMPGLKALIDKTGLENKTINPGHIGYILAPNLNAAGRLDNPEKGIELLAADLREKVEPTAENLIKLNKERQAIEQEIFDSAVDMIEKKVNLEDEKGIVLASEDWHQGVIGIVASRLVERYYRPVIMIALEGESGKGSCRSIAGLNLYQAVQHCADLLDNFGGHAMAAGLSVKSKNIKKLRDKFNHYLDDNLRADDLIPELKLDTILSQEDIDMKLYQELETLEPYGVGNPRPRFLLNNINLKNIYPVGKKKSHLKFSLMNGVQGIAFDRGHLYNEIQGENIDLGFALKLNHWQGEDRLQVALEDCNIRDNPHYHPVIFEKDSLKIADKRGIKNILPYILKLMIKDRKMAVFINSQAEIDVLKEKVNEDKNFNEKNVIFFSSLSSLKENIQSSEVDKELDDLLMISLPFSIEETFSMIDLFDYQRLTLHLLFGEQERKINRKIIEEKLPRDEELRSLYCSLQTIQSTKITINSFKEKAAARGDFSNQSFFEKCLIIFNELDLIGLKGNNIEIKPVPDKKLDLSNSISYNKNAGIINDFKEFCGLTFADNLFPFLNKLLEFIKN